jgi:hypothetical protein
MYSRRLPRFALFALVAGGLLAGTAAADAPKVLELRTQRHEKETWFHVRFETPADFAPTKLERGTYPWWTEAERRRLARIPDLVPQDEQTRNVYPRMNAAWFPTETTAGLEFVGRLQGEGKAKLLLVYPVKQNNEKQPQAWREAEVTLDFAGAKKVERPPSAEKRNSRQRPTVDDLEGQWALAQSARFAVLGALAPDFGFYPFARLATGRKYGVHVPSLEMNRFNNRGFDPERLYEITTGATAIAESLALHRMLNANFRDTGERTIDITGVRGIDIAEHPWEKMMAGKKPSPEPLARLVPHDHFYVHFKNIARFIEFGEQMDLWGTTAGRAYEMTSRDHGIKQHYEKQLCLRSSWLGKTLGPQVIRSLAVTGSDGYLREGSDLTVLFHVRNRPLFLAAVEGFIQEARKEHGEQLKEAKQDYAGVSIETFVTPLREVSLYRTTLGEVVVYSNSPVAVRRVIDTHNRKRKTLAESLDFQYMRTVFRLEDEQEDGFVFLSDAFIRELVGPASRIKEKRRLEALTSLYMETHAAMFTAWETGKLPDDYRLLLASASLEPALVYVPEGKSVAWDSRRKVAISDVYNTIHFSTPLIELPIDRVTKAEAEEYERFRTGYLNQWRRYFDPIGIRVKLTEGEMRVETYILPLVENSQYNELRRWAGNGTATFDAGMLSSKTVVQWFAHLAPELRGMIPDNGKALGDWLFVRLDDSPLYGRIAQLWMQHQLNPGDQRRLERESARLVFQLPLTLGVRIGDAKEFDHFHDQFRSLAKWVLGDFETTTSEHRMVKISRWKAQAGSPVDRELSGEPGEKKPFLPSLFSMQFDGVWYAGFSEDALKGIIDHEIARKEGKEPAKKAEVNSSIYLSPEAAVLTRDMLRAYLEWESHTRTLDNVPAWYALYRCGLLSEKDDAKPRDAAARKFLGYVPVSPDDSAFSYDRRTDEVRNARHGSLRKPELHDGVEETSPLGQLLDQFRTIRTDLRFREDGIHTVLTLTKKGKK